VFVLSVAAFSLVWQPTQQRLMTAERQYQQQLALAARLQQARPSSHRPTPVDQPLSLRISESAATAGLELQQMDSDNDLLRLTVSDAMTLLPWLDRIERDGIALQSLILKSVTPCWRRGWCSDSRAGARQRRQLRQFQRDQQRHQQQPADEQTDTVPAAQVPKHPARRAGNARTGVVAEQVQRRCLALGLRRGGRSSCWPPSGRRRNRR
jgi:general secretion pathway protein M